MTKGDISPRGIYHHGGYITRRDISPGGYITSGDISPGGIYHQVGYITSGYISPGGICHHGGNITTRDISSRGYITRGDMSPWGKYHHAGYITTGIYRQGGYITKGYITWGDDSWLYQSSYLASVYTKDGLLIWDIKTLQPEVIMQGNLIAVAYTLCIYWNQFFLGGIYKQE